MSEPVVTRDEEYLYSIQGSPYDYYYYTGIVTDGLQILVVITLPYFIGIFFDREGNISRVEKHTFSRSPDAGLVLESEEQELESWLNGIGYQENVIKVKRFFLLTHQIGIVDLPEYVREIVDNPAEHSEEEVRAACDLRDQWFIEGDFELWLNPFTNVWLDQAGIITAT